MTPEQLAERLARIQDFVRQAPCFTDAASVARGQCIMDLADLALFAASLATNPTQWVSYDDWDGLELHDTPEKAKHAAEASLENAMNGNTWAAEADAIWWGSVTVHERVVATERRPWNRETDPGDVHDEWIVYELLPVKVAP